MKSPSGLVLSIRYNLEPEKYRSLGMLCSNEIDFLPNVQKRRTQNKAKTAKCLAPPKIKLLK
jgi:hypothetical protein